MAYDKLINSIKTHFINKFIIVHVISPHPFEVLLRSNISSKIQGEQFIKEFSKLTKTEWNVRYEIKNPQKCLFHKKWLCHHSSRNKNRSLADKKNWDCMANVDIYIKRNTQSIREKDEYMCRNPPLPAVISIYPDHTHDIKTDNFLKMRKVTNETRAKFFKYFEMGLTIPEAQYLHISLLAEENLDSLSDASINPTNNQVVYLSRLWKKQKELENQNECEMPIFDIFDDQSKEYPFIENIANYDWSSFQFLDGEDLEEVYNGTLGKRSLEFEESAPSITKRAKIDDEDSCSSYERALAEDAIIDTDEACDFERENNNLSPGKNSSQQIGDNSYIVECTDKSETDPMVTYYVLESTKVVKPSCEVSHEKALESAKTLLNFMESQNDTDLADIITVRRYMRKIREKIKINKKRS